MPSKLNKTNLYLAYLDILGFKDMLRDETFATKVSDIVKALESRTELASVI